jgi:hypothetical protein
MLATNLSEHCSGSAEIENPQYADVCHWEASPEPETAGDDLNQLACIGDKVLCYWDEHDSCGWKILAVQPHVFPHMMLDAECAEDGSCNAGFQRTKGMVAVQQCRDCGATDAASLGLGEVEVVTGVALSYLNDEEEEETSEDCPTNSSGYLAIQFATTKVCTICPNTSGGGGGSSGTPIEFPIRLQRVESLVDVVFGCDDELTLTPSVQSFYAFCPGEVEELSPESPCDYYSCDGSGGA